jgi:hypothetical protein
LKISIAVSLNEDAYVGGFIAQLKALAARFVPLGDRSNTASFWPTRDLSPKPKAFEYRVKSHSLRSADCLNHKP